MKRGTIDHPKTKKLARLLDVPRYAAVGLLESLWHFAARYCPAGDVGRYGDDELAEDLDWKGDPKALTDALVEADWLNRHDQHRLIVHDWPEHCDDAVHMHLARATKTFADGNMPKMTRFAKKEKTEIIRRFREAKAEPKPKQNPALTDNGQNESHSVHTGNAPPEPEPEPVPKPEPLPSQAEGAEPGSAADTPAGESEVGGMQRPAGFSPVEQPPADRVVEFQAALKAFDAWAMLPPVVGRGFVVALQQNEHRPLLRLLTKLDDQPAIVRDGKPIARRLLIPDAVTLLVKQGMEFRSVSWACGCVNGELRDIASGCSKGQPKATKPKASKPYFVRRDE